jgi:hypothetical protein
MVISLLLFCNLALAQDFQNINQGQVAPFTGTILTPDALAKIITLEDSKLQLCEETAQHNINTLTISKDTEIDKLKFNLEEKQKSCNLIIQEKNKELDRAYEIIKKQNRNLTPLWIGVGFAAGLATSIGTIYVYEELTND